MYSAKDGGNAEGDVCTYGTCPLCVLLNNVPMHVPNVCVLRLFYSCQYVHMYIGITIDGYTHNSIFTSGDSVPLGAQIILVCRVVGLPYGTPLSYTWTCPNGPCEVEGYYGRKVYTPEHTLAVNTTSPRDGGTYT